MNANLAAVLYLVAGVLFILSLRGLSSPATSRQGNFFGMIGMAIAVATTLASHPPADGLAWVLVVLGIAIGGGHRRGDRTPGADDVDAGTGRRVPLAGRHGRGAGRGRRVLRARSLRHRHARQHPRRQPDRNVARRRHRRADLYRLGDRVPETVGAHERRADHPAGASRHQHRARRGADVLRRRPRDVGQRARLLADHHHRAGARRALDHPDRRRRHAGRDLDAELLFGLGRRRHRLHAGQFGADHHRRAGRLLRRDPVLHHVPRDEPLLHLGHPRRLRRRDRRGGRRRAAKCVRSSSARPTMRPSS